ncbi:MAG TPA: mechanosensitive ion channel [Syntrophales bacterium]|nr:mechanosensitive ion channel [Syntrophales bacterium]
MKRLILLLSALAFLWPAAVVPAEQPVPKGKTEKAVDPALAPATLKIHNRPIVTLLLSIGSAGTVNQAVSGLMLMYSRALRVGDYVQIGETEGTVAALGMFSKGRVRGTCNHSPCP